MASIRVRGHFRVNPVSGRREWVNGYVRTGQSIAGAFTNLFDDMPRPSERAVRSARLVSKWKSLVPDGAPTKNTRGWEMRFDPASGTARLGMSDETYNKWISNTLSKARRVLRTQGSTEDRYKTVKVAGDRLYTEDRKKEQQKVIAAFLEKAERTPRENKAVLTGGRPGAGKSSSLRKQGITQDRYFTLDSDDVKAEMIRQGLAPDIDGLTPMESAGLIHQESSDIADTILELLAVQGTNVVFDGTMAWEPYVVQHVETLREMGYSIKGLFVSVSPETSRRRAMARHRRGVEDFLIFGPGKSLGGRFVDPNVSVRPSRNRDVFERLKELFEGWAIYDNDVDGREPTLEDTSSKDLKFSREEVRGDG